jgi:hypothetical protein
MCSDILRQACSAELKAHIDRKAASPELLHILAQETLAAGQAAEPEHAETDAGEVENSMVVQASNIYPP